MSMKNDDDDDHEEPHLPLCQQQHIGTQKPSPMKRTQTPTAANLAENVLRHPLGPELLGPKKIRQKPETNEQKGNPPTNRLPTRLGYICQVPFVTLCGVYSPHMSLKTQPPFQFPSVCPCLAPCLCLPTGAFPLRFAFTVAANSCIRSLTASPIKW